MYRANNHHQLSLSDFNQPIGLTMSADNRWVRLAELIPWEKYEHQYAHLFKGSKVGNVAKPFRMALGSLIIQQKLGFSDRELVEEITENPYLQYFIGLPGYRQERPFDPSLLTLFRKRMRLDITKVINEAAIQNYEESMASKDHKNDNKPPKGGSGSSGADTRKETSEGGSTKVGPAADESEHNANSANNVNNADGANSGTLILDATCAPSNIRFPQDFSLLNEAREKLEKIIHRFHEDYGLDLPRTRCRKARAVYLNLAKSKRRSAKKIRSVIRFMLNCIKRDNGYLENFMHEGYAPLSSEIRLLMTIQTLYDQQLEMYQKKTHRVNDRIVSITQPYIRPIVRGKAKAPVEFGTKFDLSLDEYGMGRIEKISFDPYNEGRTLENACERYRERTGHYPERVLVDQIYRNRENRRYCKEHGIRISGPKLGRPGPQELTRDERRIENADNVDRIEVERAFSLSKRCYGLGLIRTKTEITTYSTISLSILTTNLFRILARTGRFIFAFFKYLFQLENFQLEGTTYLKYAC